MKKLNGLLIGTIALLTSACSSSPVLLDSRTNEASSLITALHAARSLTDAHDAEDILVVFDLDNTLLAMNTELGSNQWYDWQKTLRDEQGCVAERVPELLKAQGAAYHAGSMRPTQPDAAAIVRQLQEEEFRVMILTARGLDFRLPTFRELRRNHLNFSRHAIPMDDDTHFSGLTYFPDSGKARAVLYEDGVFMVAGQHKGEMLKSLLQRLDWEWPEAVVMMDDSEKNIKHMESTLGLLGIPHRLYRYTKEDSRTENFNTELAAQQWEQVAPALKTIEDVFGSVNFTMPSPYSDPACN